MLQVVKGKPIEITPRKLYTMNMAFNMWLEQELEKRNWSHSDLARAAGKSGAAISHLFTGMTHPSIGICNAIADALQIPRRIIHERAGLIQPDPEETSPMITELAYIARVLPEAEVIDLLDTARAKLRRHAKTRIDTDSGGVELV